MVALGEVFGLLSAARPPLAYVYRGEAGNPLLQALADGTHVAVFGTPGVGKTTLLQRHVDQARVLYVECQKGQTAPDVYRSILATAGARIQTERKLTSKKRLSVTLKLFSGGGERGVERTEADVTIDLGNVTDVFRTLAAHSDKKLVVLNNFHYLKRPVQKVLVRNLQYVSEQTPVRFVLMGTWTTSTYLTDLSETLPSFLTAVPVPAWSDEEASDVLARVESILSVSFTPGIRAEMIRMSAGSVRELSETCRSLLAELGVREEQNPVRSITAEDTLHDLIRRRTAGLFTRYRDMLSEYLTMSLVTLEGVDQDALLVRWFKDALADFRDRARGDDDLDDSIEDVEAGQYSSEELQAALEAVVADGNAPARLEERRRRSLVEMLSNRARLDGRHVSVSFEDVATAQNLELFPDLETLRKTARTFVSTQKDAGFHPPLVAYDPRAGALVALEPKFRAFLRTAAGDIAQYETVESHALDDGTQSSYAWVRNVMERAELDRWRNRRGQHATASGMT